jgi:DNA-binding transcriptional LysR family regulator
MECLAAALAAARLGSFTAAAEELGVTHATISRRVAAAEAWAGMKLFDRLGRGVRPTDLGQHFLIQLAQSIEQVNAIVDRERERGRLPRRRATVRISVTAAFARYWLIPRLESLERDDLKIDFAAERRAADLEHGEVDVAIRYGKGGWKGLYDEQLFDERLVPYAARRAHPAFADVEPREIVKLPLLHNGETSGWRIWSARYGVPFRPKAADRMLSDTGLSADSVRAGLGVGLWITALGPIEQAPNELIFRPDLIATPELRYHLVTREARLSGPVALLADRVRDAATET